MKYRKNTGYTLIELLIVMAVLATVSSIVVSIFFIISRGITKTNSVTSVRENGNAVLSQIEKNVSFAAKVIDPAACTASSTPLTVSSLTIQAVNGTQKTYTCSTNPATILANGVSIFGSTALKVSACSFTCQTPTLSSPPLVGIDFTLSNQTSSSFAENNASLPFHTSVILRNITK